MTLVREFNLYLTAGRTIPLVINVNQFDSGEQWAFTIYKEDGTQYIPSTGAIVGIKSDNLGIINSGTVDENGRVIITETQQMTASVGKAVFELTLDSGTHGTANFVVLVEEKPGNNADLSDSDISLIQEALNAVSPLPTGGTVGQVLTKTAQGSAWSDAGTPTQEQVAEAVSDWADEHITVETGVVIDTSLSVAGAAADAKKTGDEISDLKSAIEQASGLTSAIKSALLQLAQKVAYIDENGQDYYDDLYDALYPPIVVTAITLNTNSLSFTTLNSTQQLTATTTPSGGAVTWTSSNTSVATVSQTGVVTSVGYGNATITATSGSVSATCSVAITQATLSSISAVYTQSGTVYDTDSLDSLKSDLVVTATWSNQTTSTVASADYTLSGTLTEGTSTVTVSYAGKTTTFTVTVTEYVDAINVTYTQGSLGAPNTDSNRVSGVINSTLHFDTETLEITVPSGYELFPFGIKPSQDSAKTGTRYVSNVLYAYCQSDSGYVAKESDTSLDGTLNCNGSNLWNNSSAGWNTGTVTYSYTKSGEYGYSFTGLGFLVKATSGADITPSEIEALLTLTYVEPAS